MNAWSLDRLELGGTGKARSVDVLECGKVVCPFPVQLYEALFSSDTETFKTLAIPFSGRMAEPSNTSKYLAEAWLQLPGISSQIRDTYIEYMKLYKYVI